MSDIISSRAQRLMDKVMGTWSPPLAGSADEACIAQTSVMLAIAYIMGKEFLPCDLTDNQRSAIDEGLSTLNELIEESDYQTLEQWMDGYEAAVESGQSNISRDEAENRYYKKYVTHNCSEENVYASNQI